MKKWLCYFGFHTWRYGSRRYTWCWRVCQRCGKRQKSHVLWEYWEDESL